MVYLDISPLNPTACMCATAASPIAATGCDAGCDGRHPPTMGEYQRNFRNCRSSAHSVVRRKQNNHADVHRRTQQTLTASSRSARERTERRAQRRGSGAACRQWTAAKDLRPCCLARPPCSREADERDVHGRDVRRRHLLYICHLRRVCPDSSVPRIMLSASRCCSS